MAATKEILALSVELADAMLRSGGEIYRIEDTVILILKAYNIEDFDVYVLSNGIFASANEDKEDACSMIRHVPLGAVNLAKISALNQLARDICAHKISLSKAWEELDRCKNIPNPPKPLSIFSCGLGSGCFCYLFGGQIIDAVFAFLIGMLLQVLLLSFAKHKVPKFLSSLFGSIFVTILSILLLAAGLPIMQDKIVIGDIMPLVPGMAFTTSIRDFYNEDYLSGAIHLINALLTAFSIAAGVGIVFSVFRYISA